ncbi:MAG: ATP-dependent Clp protease proteolytic subunit [Flavipsychrobacter sp.]|jgi:ATP-dependent Clp protease protease subunit|nr:ATP-dependent Clp protease proteolytic subunit [Flavipsychrobacter sp.]
MEQELANWYLQGNYRVRNKLLEERKLFLWDQVDEKSSRSIVEQIIYLEATDPGVPIHMYINCPGGMVTAGFAIYDAMQTVSSPVYTYCIGFAASMGSVLLSGGEKGHRYIFSTAEVMIHQPAIGGFQANSADIEINARQIIRTKELTAGILAANCGQSKQKVLKDFDRDYWMNAEEALAYGIVDQLVAS